MSWVAVNKNGSEFIFTNRPYRLHTSNGDDLGLFIEFDEREVGVELPKGTIERLTMKNLTYEDEPINLNEAIKKVDKFSKEIQNKIKFLSDPLMKSIIKGTDMTLDDVIDVFTDSLWYSTDEVPETGKQILYLRKVGYVQGTTLFNPNEWKAMVEDFGIVKWFYVEDILPSDTNE